MTHPELHKVEPEMGLRGPERHLDHQLSEDTIRGKVLKGSKFTSI